MTVLLWLLQRQKPEWQGDNRSLVDKNDTISVGEGAAGEMHPSVLVSAGLLSSFLCNLSSVLINIFLPAASVKALVERHFQRNVFNNASINAGGFLSCRFK